MQQSRGAIEKEEFRGVAGVDGHCKGVVVAAVLLGG